MECKIFISFSSLMGRSASGAIVHNPFSRQIENVSCVCEGETYLSAILKNLIKIVESFIGKNCDFEIFCDYNGLRSSIYKTNRYPALSLRFQELTLNSNVSISYAGTRDNKHIKDAKELSKNLVRKVELDELSSIGFSPDFVAYADGYCNSCSLDKEGGAAYLILDKNKNVIKSNSKGFKGTTSCKMELMAILSVVASVPIGSKLLIYTDSMYCVQVLSNKSNEINLSMPNSSIIQQYFKFVSQLDCVRFGRLKGNLEDKYFDMVCAMSRLRTEEMRVELNMPKCDLRNFLTEK